MLILKEERKPGVPLETQLKQLNAVADEMDRTILYLYTLRAGCRSYIVYSSFPRGALNARQWRVI